MTKIWINPDFKDKLPAKKELINVILEDGIFPLNKIIISEALSNTRPKEKKIQKKIDYYKKHKEFEKPLVIKRKNMHLLESYTQYVAAKEMGLEEVMVIFK